MPSTAQPDATSRYLGQVLVDLPGGGEAQWRRQPAAVHAAEQAGLLKGQLQVVDEPVLSAVHEDGRLVVPGWEHTQRMKTGVGANSSIVTVIDLRMSVVSILSRFIRVVIIAIVPR